MGIVPADKLGRTDNPQFVIPRDAQRAVFRSAQRQHHGIVQFAQFAQGNILAGLQIAGKTDPFPQRGFLIPAVDPLDFLVIGGHPAADQAIGGGKFVDDIDPDVFFLGQRFGGVIPGRTGTDNANLQQFGIFIWHRHPKF